MIKSMAYKSVINRSLQTKQLRFKLEAADEETGALH